MQSYRQSAAKDFKEDNTLSSDRDPNADSLRAGPGRSFSIIEIRRKHNEG